MPALREHRASAAGILQVAEGVQRHREHVVGLAVHAERADERQALLEERPALLEAELGQYREPEAAGIVGLVEAERTGCLERLAIATACSSRTSAQ